MLVVDASLVVEMTLDRISRRTTGALNTTLVAPPLLWSEVTSALREMAFRGDISMELAELGLERLLANDLGIERRDHKTLSRRAWELASQLGWAKTYDAEYVALAEILDCQLVTLDTRLRRGTERLGYVVTPTELQS